MFSKLPLYDVKINEAKEGTAGEHFLRLVLQGVAEECPFGLLIDLSRRIAEYHREELLAEAEEN